MKQAIIKTNENSNRKGDYKNSNDKTKPKENEGG